MIPRRRQAVPSRPPASLTRPVTDRAPGPDLDRFLLLLVRTWLEVRAGHRPLAQLTPLLAPAVTRRLQAELRRRVPATPAAPGRVRRVRTTAPSARAREACVTVETADGRTTAVALRIERHRGAWRVTELMAPEAGLPPLMTSSLPDDHRDRDAFDEVDDEAATTVSRRRRDSA
jgi:hypothetical protein